MDSEVLMCMDYLLAAIDYIEFSNIMLDFKVSVKTKIKICSAYDVLARRG